MYMMELGSVRIGGGMKWTVAGARKSFAELIRQARRKPQLIYRRHEHVAVVVDPQTFREFLEWLRLQEARSVEDSFAELRGICVQESYAPELPGRTDRPNRFAEVLDELSD